MSWTPAEFSIALERERRLWVGGSRSGRPVSIQRNRVRVGEVGTRVGTRTGATFSVWLNDNARILLFYNRQRAAVGDFDAPTGVLIPALAEAIRDVWASAVAKAREFERVHDLGSTPPETVTHAARLARAALNDFEEVK